MIQKKALAGLTRPDFYSNLIDFKKKFNIKRLWAQQTRFAGASGDVNADQVNRIQGQGRGKVGARWGQGGGKVGARLGQGRGKVGQGRGNVGQGRGKVGAR